MFQREIESLSFNQSVKGVGDFLDFDVPNVFSSGSCQIFNDMCLLQIPKAFTPCF
jgi:hypothetical protein